MLARNFLGMPRCSSYKSGDSGPNTRELNDMASTIREIAVGLPEELCVSACREAFVNLGWPHARLHMSAFIADEPTVIFLRLFRFTNPARISADVFQRGGGRSVVRIRSFNFGMGPIQDGHVRKMAGILESALAAVVSEIALTATKNGRHPKSEPQSSSTPTGIDSIALDLSKALCPFCSQSIGQARIVMCIRCNTTCHDDCWAANGSACAVYACAPRASVSRADRADKRMANPSELKPIRRGLGRHS